jgi:hypothetical protein
MPISVTIVEESLKVDPVSENSPAVVTEVPSNRLVVTTAVSGPQGPPGTSYIGGVLFETTGELAVGEVPIFDGTKWTNTGVIKGGTF